MTAALFRDIGSADRLWHTAFIRQELNDFINLLLAEPVGCIVLYALCRRTIIGIKALIRNIVQIRSEHIAIQSCEDFLVSVK